MNIADFKNDYLPKIRKFLTSDWFTLILLLGAAVVVFTGTEVIGTLIFALVIGASLALTDDFLPALQALMLTICFAIRCKHSFDDFIQHWYLAPPIAILVLSHFFLYRIKPSKKGSVFWGIFASSAAVTLGGLGIITAKEYFSSTSIFYVLLLGFAMLLVYSYFTEALKPREDYEFSERFSKMMVSIIFMLCICLFEEYFSRRAELAGGFDILPFQWRNNGSTMLMLAMPFAFYLSAKKFGYFYVGILSYVAMLFSGSRGGMLFGLVELIICIAVMFIIDKRHRLAIGITVGIIGIGMLIVSRQLIDMLSYTLSRLVDMDENSIRIGLIGRGIEDFKANPLFGRGLGYMGNNDVHNNAEFTLCWYHCSPIQIIGSFGIVGILAYGFLIYQRIRTLAKNLTFFNVAVFLSYIGVELMSLVNPGVFVPFPYLFMITIYFVIIEKCNSENDKTALPLIKKGQYGGKK